MSTAQSVKLTQLAVRTELYNVKSSTEQNSDTRDVQVSIKWLYLYIKFVSVSFPCMVTFICD